MSRGASLTQMHVMEQLGRLLEIYARPSHAPADTVKFAAMYFDVLRGKISNEQLTQAVTKCRESDRHFMPKPGELHWIARECQGVASAVGGDEVSQFWIWMRGDWRTPCPACGAPWTTTPARRIVMIHHHARHHALGLPCVMACDGETLHPGRGSAGPARAPQHTLPPPQAPIPDAQLERAALAEEGNA